MASPTFARHESFYPRIGWLWKAVNSVHESPDVFLRDDATVVLGVGKNMVRAIRYWGLAFRVITEMPDPRQPRRSLAAPTGLGQLILSQGGWDPYMENPRTAWLLHWMLCRPPSAATAWELVFGLWSRGDFTDRDAVNWLADRVGRESEWVIPAEASLRRDVQCLTQMYGPPRRVGRADDLVESPFRDLALLTVTHGDASRWRFTYGDKPGLSDGVIAFACLDFISRDTAAATHTISRLALEPSSPGMVLRIGEERIAHALSTAASENGAIELVAPAGVRQVALRARPEELALQLLADEYARPAPADPLDVLMSRVADLGVPA